MISKLYCASAAFTQYLIDNKGYINACIKTSVCTHHDDVRPCLLSLLASLPPSPLLLVRTRGQVSQPLPDLITILEPPWFLQNHNELYLCKCIVCIGNNLLYSKHRKESNFGHDKIVHIFLSMAFLISTPSALPMGGGTEAPAAPTGSDPGAAPGPALFIKLRRAIVN